MVKEANRAVEFRELREAEEPLVTVYRNLAFRFQYQWVIDVWHKLREGKILVVEEDSEATGRLPVGMTLFPEWKWSMNRRLRLPAREREARELGGENAMLVLGERDEATGRPYRFLIWSRELYIPMYRWEGRRLAGRV